MMKFAKIAKSLTACLLGACIAVFCLAGTAYAAGASVTYEGGAEKFVFLPGSDYTDTDLFPNFKDAMPGDTITQEIVVKNDGPADTTVNIYLRVVPHDESSNPLSPSVAETETVVSNQDFLSQLFMTVTRDGDVVFRGSPDEVGGLAENVLLGSFAKGDSTTLLVTLEVPIELGNEYAYRVGEVDWVFVAEEGTPPGPGPEPGPEPTPTPSPSPSTGDSMMQYVLVIGVVAALAAVIIVISAVKRRKDR